MVDWSKIQYEETAKQPAAPAGLRQVAREQVRTGADNPWFGPSYVNAAQEWYGGRNVLGENNGWDNGFMSAAFSYTQDRETTAGREKNPTIVWNMFDTSVKGQEKATGVATWNDPQGRWRTGDVFSNGEKLTDQNLYDTMDRDTANLLLADFMLDGNEKSRIFKASDRTERLDRTIEERTAELSKSAESAEGSYQFEQDVESRQDWFEERNPSGLATLAASAGTGALMGSAFGPVGAVGGAVIGGLGGWLNQDQLTEQLARATEMADRAYNQYDGLRATLAAGEEYGAAGMRFISPFSNVYQGAVDAGGGTLGDGKSEFYSVDEFGQRKVSGFAQATDVGASLLDSIAQFANPAGRSMYMSTMGASAVGATAVPLTTGTVWNPRTATFDPLEDPKEWASALGSAGIDILQLGTGAAISKVYKNVRRETDEFADIGRATVDARMAGMRFTVDKATGRATGVRKWTLQSAVPSENLWQPVIRWQARRAALKDGGRAVEADDLYQAAMWLTSNGSPWRAALVNGLAEGYEEAWQGVLDPWSVSEKFTGTEVFVSAAYGFAGGVGMSTGSLLSRTKGQERAYEQLPMERIVREARFKHEYRSATTLTDEEWEDFRSGLSDKELRKIAMSSPKEAAEIAEIVQTTQDMLTIDNTRESVLGDAFARAVDDLQDSAMNNVNPNAEEQLTVLAFEDNMLVTPSGREAAHRSNSAMFSAVQMGRVLSERARATGVHIKDGAREVEKAEAALKAVEIELVTAENELTDANDSGDTALIEEAKRRVEVLRNGVNEQTAAVQRHTIRRDISKARNTIAKEMAATFASELARLRRAQTIDDAKKVIRWMNKYLEAAYDGKMTARDDTGQFVPLPAAQQEMWKEVATIVLGRHPFIDKGSFAGFIPQVSLNMTADNVNATVGVHQSTLKPMQADHDGDRDTTLNLAFLEEETITGLRRGDQQWAPHTDDAGNTVIEHNIDDPDGESGRADVFAEELRKPAESEQYKAADQMLNNIEDFLKRYFGEYSDVWDKNATPPRKVSRRNPRGFIPEAVLGPIIDRYKANVRSADPKARQTLRNDLLQSGYARQIAEYGDAEPLLMKLQQYISQQQYIANSKLAKLKMTTSTFTPAIDTERPSDWNNQKARSSMDGATVSQTLGMMGSGEGTRDSQKLWYSALTRSLIAAVQDGGWTPANQRRLEQIFLEMKEGDRRSEGEVFIEKDAITGRVETWLEGIARDIALGNPDLQGTTPAALKVIVAQMSVPSVAWSADIQAYVADVGAQTSLLQMLLRKSVEIEEDQLQSAPQDDTRRTRLEKLKGLTYDNKPHSYAAKTALAEIFRFVPLDQLLGEDAEYLGANLTMNQLEKELAGLHQYTRSNRIHRWKRSPAYMRAEHRGLGDPPYSFEVLSSSDGTLRVNAFTLLVDALETSVNVKSTQLEQVDTRTSKDFHAGLRTLQTWMSKHLDAHEERLRPLLGNATEQARAVVVLEDLIASRPQVADLIVGLMPGVQIDGAFEVIDSRVYAAPWVLEVLTDTDLARAEKNFFVYKNLAAFNVLGGTVDMDELKRTVEGFDELPLEEQQEWRNEFRGSVKFESIKSRFQQTIFFAAQDPTGMELQRLLQMFDNASTLPELLKSINSNPALLRNRADLRMYTDDVAAFESSPEDMWSMGLTGTQLRENIRLWRSRLAVMSKADMDAWAKKAKSDIILNAMLRQVEAERNGTSIPDDHNAREKLSLLRKARRNRIAFPDVIGPVAREQFMTMMADPFVPMQDKGKAPEAARAGEAIATSFSFGVRQAWEQALDGVTSLQWKDVVTNLTKLTEGPVQIMMPDGRSLQLDMTDDATVIKMLLDPRTSAFASAVMFGTARDMDSNNELQHYSSTEVPGDVIGMLDEQNNIHLTQKSGDNQKDLLRAHTAIGMVESGLIKDAMTEKKVEAQGKAMLPVTRMAGEMLVAYTSRVDSQRVDTGKMQNKLTREIWDAMMEVAALSPEEQVFARTLIVNEMQSRVTGRNVFAELMEQSKGDGLASVQIQLMQGEIQRWAEEETRGLREQRDAYSTEAAQLEGNPARSQAEQERLDFLDAALPTLREQLETKRAAVDAMVNGDFSLMPTDFMGVDNAIEMYANAQDDEVKRLNIRNLLEQGNNKEAFRNKGVPLQLLEKLATVTHKNLHELHDPDKFTAEDWKQLGLWAATIRITQFGTRAGARSLVSLEHKGSPVNRFYDRSYSYLVDGLFDQAILAKTQELALSTGAPLNKVDAEKVAQNILRGVLSEQRLGPWNSLLVTESVKVADLIARSPVGIAVAMAGNNPKRQRSQVGTSTISLAEPEPEHFTDVAFNNPESFSDADLVKIDNHFYSEAKLTVTAADGTLREIPITTRLGYPSVRQGARQDLRIFRSSNWSRLLQEMMERKEILPGEAITFQLTYVDADKKPFNSTYVNSLYFEGAGRMEEVSPSATLISGSVFGTDGWSKVAQQQVLDAAAKGGSAGFPTPSIPLATVQMILNSGLPHAKIVRKLAQLLVSKQYNDMSSMIREDLPAVEKLIKQRYVVVGKTAEGNKLVHWLDDVISRAGRGEPSPFDPASNPALVALSEEVASTLLSEEGMMGKQGLVTRTELNPEDMWVLPSLDADRLASLGIDRLGETMQWNDANTPLATVSALPQSRQSQTRGDEKTRTYQERLRRWKEIASRVRADFDPSTIRYWNDKTQERLKEVERLLGVESLARLHRSMGVPSDQIFNTDTSLTNKLVRAQLFKQLGDMMDGVRLFEHVTGRAGNLSEGVLTAVHLEDDFSDAGDRPPVFGDLVQIHLDQIMDQVGNDPKKAFQEAQQVITAYARRGVKIFLTSERMSTEVRERVADWMAAGELGYEPLGDSTSIYLPIEHSGAAGQTLRAIQSQLVVREHVNPRGITGRLLSDLWGPLLGANENTVLVDVDYDGVAQYQRMAQVLVPGDLVLANSTHNISLNYPTRTSGLRGRTDQVALLQRDFLPLLESDAAWEELLARTNRARDPKKAEASGIPLHKETVYAGDLTLIEPGVMDVEAARTRLIELLKAGHMPGEKNSTVMAGEFLPTMSADGTAVVLERAGFKMPDTRDITEQWNTPVASGAKLGVAMSRNKLNDTQTIPPPMVVTEDPMYTAHGLMLVGEFDHHRWGKWIDSALGFKGGVIKLTALKFLGNMSTNGWRPSELGSLTGPSGKRTTRNTINNFRDLFLLTGFDSRQILVDAFFGEDAARTEQDFEVKWAALEIALERWSEMDHQQTAAGIQKAMNLDQLSLQWDEFNQMFAQINPSFQFLPDPTPEMYIQDPKLRLAALMLMTMQAPTVRAKHIVSLPGLLSTDDINSRTNQISYLPPLLTEAMQSPHTPKLTEMLIGMANQHSPRDPQGRPLYWFGENFKLHTQMQEDSGEVTEVESWLQLVHPLPATEDLNAYADANLKARRGESEHIAGVIGGALGGRVVTERDPMVDLDERLNDNKIMRFRETDREDQSGDLWRMLTRTKSSEDVPARLNPLQWMHLTEAQGQVNRYSMILEKGQWTSEDRDEVGELQNAFLAAVGLTDHQDNNRAEIDYLVRQFYGSPGPTAEQREAGFKESVTAKDYKEAVRIMTYLIKNKHNPLEMSKVQVPHAEFWRKLYEAGTWAPALGKDRVASSWDEWVYALFGQLESSKAGFDSRFRQANDGFFHTYVGAIESMENLPVSMDETVNVKLLDRAANEPFVSIDPGVNTLLADPVLLPEMSKTLATLLGENKDKDPTELPFIESSSMIAHREKVDNWAKKQELAPQVEANFLEYSTVGAEYIDKVHSSHAILHGLVNLSVMNRLFNPALFVSALLEVPARTALESFTDLVLGDQIRGGGILANRAADQLEKVNIRWRPKYSVEEIQSLRKLARQLSSDTNFMEFLYKELMYTHMVTPGRGRLGGTLEKGAAASARMFADPRWGMPAVSIAELYLGAVLETFAFQQADVPVESFVQQMEQDPLYLVKNQANEGGFTAHKAGMNRVAQARALKPTALSSGIMGSINTLTEGSLGYNALGHLLKFPFMFTTFTANAFITLSGLGGVDQLFAVMLDAQNKPGLLNRMQAGIRGRKVPADEQFDMSHVIEGIDLSRAFIRGGITQTGLFAAAMMAQGLGLGGEDEEMRKRRKLSEYLNTPLMLDPREMQNDFLLADAIFLDNIPVFGTIFRDNDMPEGEERSVVIPHWIIRQFTSPMMGTMRFLNTGDPMDIWRGFQDSFSVMPNSVSRLWREAELTASLLFDRAAEEDYEGNSVEAQASVTKLLISAVSVYEKALIENSFVNSLINGSDAYNRNPWYMPATDDIGRIQHREGHNNMPLRSGALESYVDEDTGETGQAYDTRSGLSGYAHQYAENNHTFALLASLFTGQLDRSQSTFNRNNMVVAEKKVDLPTIKQPKVEAYLLSAFAGKGAQEHVTMDEAIRLVKKKYEDADIFWNQSDVEREAQAIYDSYERVGGLSVIDEKGAEYITKDGASGVFTSLANGALDFSDGSLAGLWIPFEMRQKIEGEWAEDLIQEGVDLGLGQQAAEYRMRRLMRGDFNDPEAPGLREVLYSDKIPYSGQVKYNQLNMTYMIGPDGKPWATPFKRPTALAAFGVPVPQTVAAAPAGMRKDARGKLVDEVFGINLGMHGLERQLEEPPEMPDESALDAAAAKTYTPSTGSSFTPWKRWNRSGYGGYSRGGYGGGGSSYGPPFQRMQDLPKSYGAPRTEDIPFINANTPYVRRSTVRRERVTSKRGRLKQWQ